MHLAPTRTPAPSGGVAPRANYRVAWDLEGAEEDQAEQLIRLVRQQLRGDQRAWDLARRRERRRSYALFSVSAVAGAALTVLAVGVWALMERDLELGTVGSIALVAAPIVMGVLGFAIIISGTFAVYSQRHLESELREVARRSREASRSMAMRQAMMAARKLSIENDRRQIESPL